MPEAKSTASWAIFVLGLVLAAAALWVTGGPGTARKQNHDATRLSDLSDIWTSALCQAQENGWALPETLDVLPPCRATTIRWADPITQKPYRIERRSPQDLRLCAELELDDPAQHYERWFTFEGVEVAGQPGCFDFHLQRMSITEDGDADSGGTDSNGTDNGAANSGGAASN